MALWGGRFQADGDPLFRAINDSLAFDARLLEQDVAGSIAWARALEQAGVLAPDETARMVAALQEIAAGADPAAVAGAGEEDVHSWVEARLIERVGDLGKKLHTGRSRNDQVATDLRLWTRGQVADRRREIRGVQQALVKLGRREHATMLPGYTHLQRAQPILLAHWCLAYFEMLQRDHERLGDAARRLDQCPLGSGALAGTSYGIDREALARALGFAGPTANSLDAVSDRDFVVEVLSAVALCGVHLSRLAEDLVFYASGEAGFVELDDALTSGSSLLPQKKNPDAMELVRGKTGRLIGSLVSVLVTLKGLPLAYNKDLQEDKEPLFDAMDSLALCLAVIPPILGSLQVDRDRAAAAARAGYGNALELAEYLVARGITFREAHETTGRIVRHALERGVPIEALSHEEMTGFSPLIGADVGAALSPRGAMNRRAVYGGTAPARVEEALRRAAAVLGREVVIRQARIDDLDEICRIVDYWAGKGENLPRGRNEIIEAIQDFGVAVAGQRVVGCGSLYVYTTRLAEIRSLGIDPQFQGGGFGSDLVRYFVGCAGRLQIPRVFVLTRAPRFFGRLGFEVEAMETFPEKIWKDCNSCTRRSCCDEIPMVYEVPA